MKPLSEYKREPLFRWRALSLEALAELGAEVVVDDLLRVRCIRMPEQLSKDTEALSPVPDWERLEAGLGDTLREAS